MNIAERIGYVLMGICLGVCSWRYIDSAIKIGVTVTKQDLAVAWNGEDVSGPFAFCQCRDGASFSVTSHDMTKRKDFDGACSSACQNIAKGCADGEEDC